VVDATTLRARSREGTVVNNKWKLESLLGAGGMACVYSATHRNGNRVAIKLLHPELCAVPGIVTRFLREGYLANRVGHPGAVTVIDDDRTEDGACFLVMELLDGHSLERYAKAGRERLPRGTVLRLVAETLDVLAAAHAKGIIHRDVKPANLFLTSDGHIKVLDFGIARLVEATGDGQLTQTGATIGTPAFMPPEQARGRWEQVDARTDVWAVGATTYALLIGDRPRHAETTQEAMLLAMTQPLAPLARVLPDVTADVAAVVDRAVAHDRDARWPDAVAMRDAVARLLANSANFESSAPWPPPSHGFPASRGGGTMVVSDPALTTGRPFASQPQPSRPPDTRKALLVAGAAAMVTLALLGAGVLIVRDASHHAPPASGTPAPAMPPSAVGTSSSLPPAPASAPAPAMSAPEASSRALASPTAPVPTASTAGSTVPSASAAHRPPPGPHGPAPNPFDLRF
jgi:eukaryotic-like serine/threonine-protein kinase